MPTFTPTTQTLLADSTGGTPAGPYTASPSPATGTQQNVVLSVTCNVGSVKGGTLGCFGAAYLWYSVDGGTNWTDIISDVNASADFNGTQTITLGTVDTSLIQLKVYATSGNNGGEGYSSVSAWSITYTRRRVTVC